MLAFVLATGASECRGRNAPPRDEECAEKKSSWFSMRYIKRPAVADARRIATATPSRSPDRLTLDLGTPVDEVGG